MFVGSDGLPYCLMSRIITDNLKLYRWVLTVPGNQMNQIKMPFKILDKIILEPLGKEALDFKTVKSYQYFIDCKDNHKAWQAFEITLHGTNMGLIRLIRLCCLESESPFPTSFLQWLSNIEKPNMKSICQLTLSVTLLIYIQRAGDQNNDFECSEPGRVKFIDTFFSFNYREVEYNEIHNFFL